MTPEPLQLQNRLLGYKNHGNTCYLNSILQLLYRSPFTQFLSEFAPRGGWERCPPYISNSVMQIGFINQSIFSAKKLPYLDPRRFLNCIQEKMPEWEVFQQQDASEFLQNLQEILDSDLKMCGEYQNSDEASGMGNPDDDLVAMNATGQKTVISALFEGVLENRITYHSCGFQSRSFEKFLDLSIPISGARKRYDRKKENSDLINRNDEQDPGFPVHEAVYDKTCLTSCLDSFFENTILEHENQYSCSGCKKLTDATKSTKAKTTLRGYVGIIGI